jgi:hypothetical protein
MNIAQTLSWKCATVAVPTPILDSRSGHCHRSHISAMGTWPILALTASMLEYTSALVVSVVSVFVRALNMQCSVRTPQQGVGFVSFECALYL